MTDSASRIKKMFDVDSDVAPDDKLSTDNFSQTFFDPEKKSLTSDILANSIIIDPEHRRAHHSVFSFRMGRESLQYFPPKKERKIRTIKTDKRLQLWWNYLTEQQKLNEKLANKAKRPINDLVMNTMDAYRSKHQDQLIFDYITILDPPDEQRGSPAFWHLPVRIMPKCPCDAPLEAQMDASQRCQIPEMEFIGVPRHIREKRNCWERANKMIEHWNNQPYRKQKIDEQSDRIQYIQPHKPDIDELIVVGSSVQHKHEGSTKLLKPIPVITITNPFEYEENPSQADCDQYVKQSAKVQLKIDNTILTQDSPATNFEIVLNASELDVLVYKDVVIQNYGLTTLHFHWRPLYFHNSNLPLCPMSYNSDIFIFNNCDFIIMPGQIYTVKFMIKPDNYGMLKEQWKLKSVPSTTDITFNLWAMIDKPVDIHSLKEKLNIPEQTPSKRTDTDIFEQLNIKIDRNCLVPASFITEEERFYLANLCNKKLPKYFYQKSSVQNLKYFYNKTLKDYPKWNLNIDEFIRCIKHEYTHLSIRNQILSELNQILEPMKHIPTEKINTEFRKRQLVYNALCRMVDEMATDAAKLEYILKLYLPIGKYPVFDSTVPYQERNLYTDPKQHLYVNAAEKRLPKRCVQSIDHRIATMSDKHRPPIRYKSRMKQAIEFTTPFDRYLAYKETDSLWNVNATTVYEMPLPKKPKTKVTKTLLPAKSSIAGSSDVSDKEIITIHTYNQVNKLRVFHETLYIKTYIHLQKAIDEITSIIESCNLSARKTTLTMLQHLYDDLEYFN